MEIKKSVLVNKEINLEDLRKAFEDIVDCSMDLNEPNFLEESWIDDFENQYDIKLSKNELPLVQKYFEEWLTEPAQEVIYAEYKWRSAILKSLSSLSKLKFGRWKFKNENVKNILLDCYYEITQ
jgi:hypothetical protein